MPQNQSIMSQNQVTVNQQAVGTQQMAGIAIVITTATTKIISRVDNSFIGLVLLYRVNKHEWWIQLDTLPLKDLVHQNVV